MGRPRYDASAMIQDPQVVAELGRSKREENWRFRGFLKLLPRHRLRQINQVAEELGRAAESQMDCRTCGACCRENWIPVGDDEAERLASGLSLPVLSFRERCLSVDPSGESGIDAAPCPFLTGMTCSVYEHRPDACRGYPYIGGDVASRMIDIIERAEVCPIVFEMLESLKLRLHFK